MTTYLNYGLSDITKAIEEGKEAEQHRIIKLLEDERINWHCDECLGESLFDIGYENGWVKEKLIALIKGEINE